MISAGELGFQKTKSDQWSIQCSPGSSVMLSGAARTPPAAPHRLWQCLPRRSAVVGGASHPLCPLHTH